MERRDVEDLCKSFSDFHLRGANPHESWEIERAREAEEKLAEPIVQDFVSLFLQEAGTNYLRQVDGARLLASNFPDWKENAKSKVKNSNNPDLISAVRSIDYGFIMNFADQQLTDAIKNQDPPEAIKSWNFVKTCAQIASVGDFKR